MRKQLWLATLACACLCTACADTNNDSALSYLIRNGVADTVPPLARLQNLNLADLPKCRLDVASDFGNLVSDASNFTFSLFNDPVSAASSMSSAAPEIFSAAYEVLDHITSTYGPDALVCVERAAQGQSLAGCQSLLDQLRGNVANTFLKMGAVTAAITKSIARHCEFKR